VPQPHGVGLWRFRTTDVTRQRRHSVNLVRFGDEQRLCSDGRTTQATHDEGTDMLEALLWIGLVVGLPMVYCHGKRAGFDRHQCIQVTASQDRAPQTFVVVQCPACNVPVECALHVRRSYSGGVPSVTATIDPTDLEHHTLTHIDEVRREAA